MSFFGKKTDKPEEPQIAPAEPVPQQVPGPAQRPAYGIEEAMRLMRSLPVDQNVDLVVHVIKSTLESMNVRLADILNDAAHRQQVLGTRIKDLKGEIAGLQNEVQTRQSEIARLEKDLAETTSVRERLATAEAAPKGAPSANASARPPTEDRTPKQP
jgi:hypothetical protein